MPFVLADLIWVLVGLMVVLLSTAGDWIVKTIGHAIGSIHIDLAVVSFDLHVGQWFIDAVAGIFDWVVGVGKGLFQNVEHWFSGHSYITSNIAYQTVQVVSHLGDQIAHIVTRIVPAAQRAAEAHTNNTANAVRNEIRDAVAASSRESQADLNAADRAIYATITRNDNTIEAHLTTAVNGAITVTERFATAADKLVHDYAAVQVQAARDAAQDHLNTQVGLLGQAIAAANATAAADLITAETYANAKANQVATTDAADLAAARLALTTAIGGVQSADQAALQAAQQAAAAALTAQGQILTGEIASVQSADQAALDAAKAAAAAALTAQGQTLTGEIAAQGATFSGDLTSLQTVLTGLIATSIAPVLARVVSLEKCAVGVCESSPNNFGSLLKDALGLAEFAGLGAFLATIVNDPAGAEHQYAGVVQGAVNAGHSAFDALLSL